MKKLLGLGLILFSAGAFAQDCTVEASVGIGETYVKGTVTGPCKDVEKYIQDKASQGSALYKEMANQLGLSYAHGSSTKPKSPAPKKQTFHKYDVDAGKLLLGIDGELYISIDGVRVLETDSLGNKIKGKVVY
jgi:hypothetical protein